MKLLAIMLLALTGCATVTTPKNFGVSIGAALEGAKVFGWSPGPTDLALMKTDQVNLVSIPVWYGADYSGLNPLIDRLHEQGFTVHVVPHTDGEGTAINQMIFNDPFFYKIWCESVAVAANHLKPGETFELWNEAIPTDFNWSHLDVLYETLAPELAAFVHATIQGVKVVLPIANDQSPEEANNMMASWNAAMIASIQAQVKLGTYDLLSAHLYPSSPTAPDVLTRAISLTKLSILLNLPIFVTEYGQVGNPAFYKEVATWTQGHSIAWQWYSPDAQDFNIRDVPTVLQSLQSW